MAFIKLGITSTLDRIAANVRAQTGTISEQASELYKSEMDNIVHDAILDVFADLRSVLLPHYWTEDPVTETVNIIDISTKDILFLNPESLTLVDSTHGPIPILTPDEWSWRKHWDGATGEVLADRLFARIVNKLATDNKLVIETERGSATTAPGSAILFGYYRGPKKTVFSDTDRRLDIPDAHGPLVTDKAIIQVFERVAGKAPQDVSDRYGRRREEAMTAREAA